MRCSRLGFAGTAMLAAFVFQTGSTPVAGQQRPADANWIMNSGAESVLVVTEPASPPPGLGQKAPSKSKKSVEGLGDAARPNIHAVSIGADFTRITTQHIPDYAVIFSSEVLDALQQRPKFATEFPNGIKAELGDTIRFGQDIGYDDDICATGHGRGYWPPATFCSDANINTIYLPNTPQPTDDTCYTTLGPVGLFLNGAVLFNWSDAQSYQNAGVWHNAAAVFEQYDFDICSGHAAAGVYHHHTYTQCLAAAVKDADTGHSPIWGYSADGYAIHGPWQAEGVRAHSCWAKRDYSPSSPTGCGTANKRTCQLVDNHDISKGTKPVSAAPDAGSQQMSMFSKNPVTVDSGAYFEDFYYDPSCTTAGPEALDARNGHDHGGLGYHFHMTVDAQMRPVFPYSFGPVYRGKLFDNAMTGCGEAPFSQPKQSAGHNAAPADTVRWSRVDLGTVSKRF